LTLVSLHPFLLFFFHSPVPFYIYTLFLHDALPIFLSCVMFSFIITLLIKILFILSPFAIAITDTKFIILYSLFVFTGLVTYRTSDRKSTRLNSSHVSISYAVFCLIKKI